MGLTLRASAEPDASRKTGMFITGVRFLEDRTSFEPTCPEFHAMIDLVADAIVSTATHAPRIIFARAFKVCVVGMSSCGCVCVGGGGRRENARVCAARVWDVGCCAPCPCGLCAHP